MSKSIMFAALVLGLTPWLAPALAMYAYPWLSRQEAWRIAGLVTMCMWIPSCLLVGVFASRWASQKP